MADTEPTFAVSDDAATPPERDLDYWAWTIIANAHGGDWEKATPEWREAAERWRDAFHESLSCPGCGDPTCHGACAHDS